MAGVDGIKPPFADLESAVLLTELNSLKGAGKQAGVAPARQVVSLPETAGYRHKGRQVCLTEGLEACRTVSAII